MTASEQDLVVGRTVREYYEQKRLLALLRYKATLIATDLRDVVNVLETGLGMALTQSIPSRDEVRQLQESLTDTYCLVGKLAKSLTDMGYPPHD